MATARLDNHVGVLFKNDIVAVVEIEHWDSCEFGRRAARLRNSAWIHEMYQRLYYSVVGGVHVSAERKRTLAITEERRVPVRIVKWKLVVILARVGLDSCGIAP